MSTTKLVTTVAAIVLVATNSAAAPVATFQCSELKKLIGAAGNHFAELGTSVRERETAADVATRFGVTIEELGLGKNYKKITRATAQQLSGADDCEIVDVTMDSEEADLRQTAFNCRYAGLQSISDSLSKELESCLQKTADPESDSQSLTIWIDRVDSGEGYSSIAVEVESNAVQGLTLGIVKTVCLNRSEGGCDDED